MLLSRPEHGAEAGGIYTQEGVKSVRIQVGHLVKNGKYGNGGKVDTGCNHQREPDALERVKTEGSSQGQMAGSLGKSTGAILCVSVCSFQDVPPITVLCEGRNCGHEENMLGSNGFGAGLHTVY